MKLEPVTFVVIDHPPKYLPGNQNPQICSDCGTKLRRVGLNGNAWKEAAAFMGMTLQRVFECPHCQIDYWVYPENVEPIRSSDDV